MHNNKNIPVLSRSARGLLASALLGLSGVSYGDLLLYEKNDTTFSTDGYMNTFYTSSKVNRDGKLYDRRQARVRMGYLPNWIGFNFKRENYEGLTIGARASFWVSINDSQSDGTSTAIDVRQFYGTFGGWWGEVLFGKDFGLFSRSNIMLDEMLSNVGNVSDTLGLVDGGGVSFGNIGTGFPYPFPTSQITYRNNELLVKGLRLAVGVMDPYDASQVDETTSTVGANQSYQNSPRFEFETSYHFDVGASKIYAWVNGQQQNSKNTNKQVKNVESKGLGYGVQFKHGPYTLVTSGFNAKGINPFFTNNYGKAALRNIDSHGYLVQGSWKFWEKNKIALSYGITKDNGNGLGHKADYSTKGVAYTRTVNDNLKLLAEYTKYHIKDRDGSTLTEHTNTMAFGAVLSW